MCVQHCFNAAAQLGVVLKLDPARMKLFAADKARARADGRVTPGERRHIEREQDRASRDIHREKHDRQQAPRPR